MNPHLFLAYCLAVAILLLMPGPIVALVIANSLSHGRRSGLATVAGSTLGNALLLLAIVAGLLASFALLSEIFRVVRWGGALYLIWLGIRTWRAHDGARAATGPPARRPSSAVFLQGLFIASTNPKAIVFYVAFLPQFIDPRLPAGPQLLAMSGTLIIMGLLSDTAYALLAARARGWLSTPGRRRVQSLMTGTLLIGVGCGLLLARRGG